VHTWKSMEVPPQQSGHWAPGGPRCRAGGNWTCASCDDPEERNIAKKRSEDSGSLQRLTNHNSMSGTPGPRPGATICKVDQPESAGSPRPQLCH